MKKLLSLLTILLLAASGECQVASGAAGVGATAIGKAEDAAHTSGDVGMEVLTKRTDVLASSAGSGGDYATLNTDAYGALWTTGTKLEDASPADQDSGIVVYGIARTSIAAMSTTNAKYGPAQLDAGTGAWYTNPIGNTARVCVAVTPDTSAYAAGDIVGGLLTFANVFRANVNSGHLRNIEITGTEIDSIGYQFCPFLANPSGSTVADQGAPTIVAADLQKALPCIAVSSQKAFATTELYSTTNIGLAIDATSTSVYGLLITTGAPTWAAAQTVNVCLTFIQD